MFASLRPVRLKLVALSDEGVVVKERGAGEFVVAYADVLTAERPRSRRGLHLHVRGRTAPLRVKCRSVDRLAVESSLRFAGVRIVDSWGAIIAPTLLDFEDELAREPRRLRQSSDSA